MFKFKSLAVIAACAAAMVLVSCEKEKEFPITPGETQLTTTAEGGEISLSVICEQSDWQWSFAEEDASQWCTGKKDKDKLVLTVAPNYTGKDRSLTIILSSSNSSAEVVLTQGSSVTFYKVAVPDFSNMDAAKAAAILGSMTDNLDLAAEILTNINATTRGAIMGEMDPAVAARITKMMNPNS